MQQPKHIFVIGAGISGLSIADYLLTQTNFVAENLHLTILEARNRFGGRTHSITKDFNGRQVAFDLGASWIHGPGTGNPMTSVAVENNIELSELEEEEAEEVLPEEYFLSTDEWEGYGFDNSGKQIPQLLLQEASIKVEQIIYAKARKDGPKLENDVPFRQLIDQPMQQLIDHLQHKYSSIVQQPSREYFRLLVENIIASFEGYDGASMNEISSKHYNEYHIFPGVDRYVIGGYGNLANAMANKLLTLAPNHFSILLNHQVTHITTNKSNNTVTIEGVNHGKDSSPFKMEGHCVVVTVSLGVLKANKIVFNPPLPQSKLEAIDNIGMGVLDKVFLEFKTAFWETDDQHPIDWLLVSHQEIGLYVSFLNLQYYAGPGVPVLCCFLAGPQARHYESQSDQLVQDMILSTLASHYGQQVKDLLVSMTRTSWAADPYSLGGYSFTKIGIQAHHWDALAEPAHDIIFFAGEASMRNYFSTVHGAFLSGVREAKRIAAHFHLSPTL